MTLAPWPERPDLSGARGELAKVVRMSLTFNYERARADAAMERLRLAVEALDRIATSAIHRPDIAREALAAIDIEGSK